MEKGMKVQFTTKDGYLQKGRIIDNGYKDIDGNQIVVVEWKEGGCIITRQMYISTLTEIKAI